MEIAKDVVTHGNLVPLENPLPLSQQDMNKDCTGKPTYEIVKKKAHVKRGNKPDGMAQTKLMFQGQGDEESEYE